MRGIGGTTGVGGAGPIGRAPARGRTGFALPESKDAAASAAAMGVAGVGLGLLAVQQGHSDQERDAAARRRADGLLEELAGLQAELLGGTADLGRLQRLAALAEGEAGADPTLREAVAAVALRARVELARRGR
jgi:hypothetical protein